MGFFSNLLKKEAQKIISDKIDSFSEAWNPQSGMDNQMSDEEGGESGLRKRLEAVVAREYSDCELRREVPASEMCAGAGAKNYSYGLYRNGAPIAFMMVMEDRNHYKKKEVCLAQEAARQFRIPYMNFMSHLPNRTEYISNRLRENIK